MPQIDFKVTASKPGVSGDGKVRRMGAAYGPPRPIPGVFFEALTPGTYRYGWRAYGPPGTDLEIVVLRGAAKLAEEKETIGSDSTTAGYVQFVVGE